MMVSIFSLGSCKEEPLDLLGDPSAATDHSQVHSANLGLSYAERARQAPYLHFQSMEQYSILKAELIAEANASDTYEYGDPLPGKKWINGCLSHTPPSERPRQDSCLMRKLSRLKKTFA